MRCRLFAMEISVDASKCNSAIEGHPNMTVSDLYIVLSKFKVSTLCDWSKSVVCPVFPSLSAQSICTVWPDQWHTEARACVCVCILLILSPRSRGVICELGHVYFFVLHLSTTVSFHHFLRSARLPMFTPCKCMCCDQCALRLRVNVVRLGVRQSILKSRRLDMTMRSVIFTWAIFNAFSTELAAFFGLINVYRSFGAYVLRRWTEWVHMCCFCFESVIFRCLHILRLSGIRLFFQLVLFSWILCLVSNGSCVFRSFAFAPCVRISFVFSHWIGMHAQFVCFFFIDKVCLFWLVSHISLLALGKTFTTLIVQL